MQRGISYGVTTVLSGLAVFLFFGWSGPFLLVGLTLITAGMGIVLYEAIRR